MQDKLLGLGGGTIHEGNQTFVDLTLILGVPMREGLQDHPSHLLSFICI